MGPNEEPCMLAETPGARLFALFAGVRRMRTLSVQGVCLARARHADPEGFLWPSRTPASR